MVAEGGSGADWRADAAGLGADGLGMAVTEKFDQEAFDLAKKQAADRFPLPELLPTEAAFRTAILSGVMIAVFIGLDELMRRDIAGYITVGLATLVTWADNRMRWRNHSREQSEAYDFYKSRPKR